MNGLLANSLFGSALRSCAMLVLFASLAAAEPPELADDRLQLSLFSEDPQIVTPIGIAIDAQNHIYVIESHTHHPPDGYQGPRGDRIKVFVDHDDDGTCDRVSVFAEDIQQAMNLAFSPAGELYVVCAREVLRLRDVDRDGVSEQRESVLELITDQRYAHNCLLSITFDCEGWMYLGRGNVGSDAYRLRGPEGTEVVGFGDGGSVIRCRQDGTELSEYATGFWNPFDLTVDRSGRLLLVDNDPDACGPNRLLEVVAGGDYGYKSLFGGAGTHPFQGWDGTLPGTLPFIAGTGEAPSGLIDCRRSALPIEYANSVLVTLWNENTLERFELDPDTAGLIKKSVFMSGDQNFRPVAMDCDRRGNLFVTDWVKVDYPNHGRGRIWRIATRSESDRITPETSFDDYHPNTLGQQMTAFQSLDGVALVQQLAAGKIIDPRLRHSAVMRLADEGMATAREACFEGDAALRMIGLLASQRSGDEQHRIIPLLSDPDPQIRRAAILWAAKTLDLSLAGHLANAIAVQPVTPEVFESYLAGLEVLNIKFLEAYHAKQPSKANQLPRSIDPQLIVDLAADQSLPVDVRCLAIKRFDRELAIKHLGLLDTFMLGSEAPLQIAAIETLTLANVAGDRAKPLIAIAMNPASSETVRTSAIAALESINGLEPKRIEPLLDADSQVVAEQAKRTLQSIRGVSEFGQRPASTTEWHQALAVQGNPLLGRHVFFSSRVGCAKCHPSNGRGGTLGPDLSGIVASKSRQQIIDAILDPSADFAPQYQAWMVLTTDGVIHRGLQLDHKSKGAISLTLEHGGERYFTADQIESYRALPTSLMPSGLTELMSIDEFRDLIAYLTSFRD